MRERLLSFLVPSIAITFFSLLAAFGSTLRGGSLEAAGLYTSPNTGITVTPDYLVIQGAATNLGGGTYSLSSSLSILANDTLLLPAGTTLLPTAAAVDISVSGRLDAAGTPGAPVTIGASSSSAWSGIKLNIITRASSLSHLALRNVAGVALRIAVTDTPLPSTVSNLTIADVQGTALDLQNIPPGAGLSFPSLTITNAGLGIRIKDCAGLTFERTAISGLNASGAVKSAIWIERGGSGVRFLDGTFSGPGIVQGDRLGGAAGADSLVIANCIFSGTTGETGIELARSARVSVTGSTFSGYGVAVAAHAAAGLAIAHSTFTSCGTALRLVDLPAWASADSTAGAAAAWLEIAGDTTNGSWQSDASGNLLAAAPQGFSFPFAGVMYDSVAVFADGHLRLARRTADYLALSAGVYEGKSEVMTNGTIPAVYGFADDLEPSGDTVARDGYGIRFFRPGDADMNGATATETVAVVAWFASHADDDASRRNRFAVHLFPDGRIRWLVNEAPYIHTRHGFYAGARSETGKFEITAAVNPSETQTIYSYNPASTISGGTRIDSSTLSGNTTAVLADTAVRLLVTGSTITGNTTGIALGGGMESVTIATTNLVSNTTADLAITATSGAVTITQSYMGSAPILTGNTGLVTTTSPSGAPVGIVSIAPGILQDAGCLLVRTVPGHSSLLDIVRRTRDHLFAFRPFRLLADLYYRL